MIKHHQKLPYLEAYIHKVSFSFLVALSFLVTGVSCDSKSEESASTATSPAITWETYSPPEPTEAMIEILQQDSAIYPYQECRNDLDVLSSVPSESITTSENGSELCVWHHPAGCVPDGLKYTDVMSCDEVRTLGPSWFIPPIRRATTPPELLANPEYRRELEWVTDQVAASGCACCHSSSAGYASFFDIDAPESWIDTLTMTGIIMAAGFADEHKYLGYLPPEINHGFDREITLFATTDIPRMRAFFSAEFERREGTEEDVTTARQTFIQINGGLFMEPTECGVGEGMDENGNLIWKGGNARQVYIQEIGSNNPGSPPNLDKPEGTVWATYANLESEGLISGTIAPGVIIDGARQAVPEEANETATFEDGKKYRLFTTPDFLRIPLSNCTFTFGEAVVAEEKTCESDQTVCTTLKIPENLPETPEKLVVGLFLSLPPLGPPDVFPPFSVDTPELDLGGEFDVLMDANAEGEYQVFAVLYMPGGGLASWQPVAGVDYVAQSEPLILDGTGMTLPEPLVFSLAE